MNSTTSVGSSLLRFKEAAGSGPKRVAGLSTGLALILMLAGCGGGSPRLGDSEVDDEASKSMLSAVEGTWRSSNGADNEVRTHKDADCFLLTSGEEGDLMTSSDGGDGMAAQVLCGPSRRIGTPDGHVWDSFEVEAFISPDNKVIFGESSASDVAQALNGRALWRPDGGKPVSDADALQPPPAPPAERGLLNVTTSAPDGIRELKASNFKLIGPDDDLTLTGLGSVSVIKDQSGKSLRAADGEAFTVLRIKVGEGAAYPGKDGWGLNQKGDAQLFLTVNEERKPLEFADGAGEHYVIASASKDATLGLGLRIAGVDQLLALPSGTLQAGPATAFYRAKPTVQISQSIPSQELEKGDFRHSVSATFETAYLTAWDARQGWAPAGKAWLELPFEGDLRGTGDGFFNRYRTTLDPSAMTATVDGKKYPLLPALLGDKRLVWQVPATSTSVELALTPKFKGQATSPEMTEPDSVSMTAKGVTFTVKFE